MVTFIMMMHIMRQFGPPHKKTCIMAVARDGLKPDCSAAETRLNFNVALID